MSIVAQNPTASIHESRATAAEPWALTHFASHLRLWIAAAAGLAADLWSKSEAFRRLDANETVVVVKNLCSLRLSLNPGALFGIGAGMATVFVGASVLALLFVLYLFANSGVKHWSMHLALGFVLAGALGNLFDRTTQAAYVGYLPSGNVIGKLLSETPDTITIGDFPSGEHPRTIRRPTDPRSGIQPVVRDFIKIELQAGGWSLWPWIFNIADALLVIGVAILLINFWRERKESPAPASA